jgi:maltooligosyltrehalose trehalohydrolase
VPVPAQFGAVVVDGGVRFRVPAPDAREVRLVLHGERTAEHPMERSEEGIWTLFVPGLEPGRRYGLRRDDLPERPDPASRFQPLGVHGPSEIVDPAAFRWTDASWHGPSPAELVIYELHVGTFTDAGTFAALRERLPDLRDLGVTALELMPIADFAGDRGWGYDGVALYAPSRAYGQPDELRALVDRAHALGIAVILDVVYNHLGPEGAYLPEFYPQYLDHGQSTPWGPAVNLNGPGANIVRQFITDNALHWVREYHLDGLRFDATHALIDRAPTHFLRELAATLRAASPTRLILHAEDYRNLDDIVRDDRPTAWGLDGVWADDFHHVVRRLTAGDEHAYYADFRGTAEELACTIRQGWLYCGERSTHLNVARGTDASTIPMHRLVVCIQNHDQIGNRAFGDRLHHEVDAATWRAASTILLTVPMTPLLFMGQEWAAATPFRYFTDLHPGLGEMVTEGRRCEFKDFPEFATEHLRNQIPDPQALATFESSRLRWEERALPPHAASLALYKYLLRLRRTNPAVQAADDLSGEAFALDEQTLAIRRSSTARRFWIVARLRGAGLVDLADLEAAKREACDTWRVLATPEDPEFAVDPMPVQVSARCGGPRIAFARPGAVIFSVSDDEAVRAD